MNDDQLLRYSRQIMLPEFGFDAQQRLLDSHCLIVGAGGLGSPAALYLAAAGVGHLTIADPDAVDLSNLQRQILHGTHDLGRAKVDSARDRLAAINVDTRVSVIPARLQDETLLNAVEQADVVLDASDNFATRFAVDAACCRTRKPLVSGAAIRVEGQLTVFRHDLQDGPCYHCLYRDGSEVEETCAENGILAPIVGIIGSLQALEAIKLLTGIGDASAGRLLLLDGKTMEIRTLRYRKDPACPICSIPAVGRP